MGPSSWSLLTLVGALLAGVGNVVAQVMVVEVPVGGLAILECPSNDEHHRFLFWHTPANQVIGPGSEINQYKYKYEVLTGILYIKAVSTAEAGFYQCWSRTLTSPPEYKDGTVELIVKKDWEEVYEEDTQNNDVRTVVALTVILVVLLLILFALRMRRTRPLRFRDLIDEESQDETPAVPRAEVYRPTTLPSTSSAAAASAGEDNLAVAVDTDFPTVFQNSHDARM